MIPVSSIPRDLGKVHRPSQAELKNYLSKLDPEEARQVIELWKQRASRKDMLRFTATYANTIRI